MKSLLRRFHQPALLLSLAATLALGIVGALGQSPNAVNNQDGHPRNQQYAELEKAPDKVRSRPNPLEGNVDAVEAGRKLFDIHCAECHGDTAAGKKKAPTLRCPEVQTASPGALFWILTNGVVRRGMPVWSKLPDQQRWQIVAYLKSL